MMSGKVVHFEIPADDVERARSFYREAFGWQVTPMPEMDYTIVNTVATSDDGIPTEPGAINGGLFKREGPLTSPVITIDVADVDEALAQVEKAGGKVVLGRQAVGEMGYTGYFTDTEGNVVGLWQNAS
ncbi:VOC family protein [Micromonospora sp. CPCC 205371]|nr:VOC family protein [Micromonospora sp. CPCC 205371]